MLLVLGVGDLWNFSTELDVLHGCASMLNGCSRCHAEGRYAALDDVTAFVCRTQVYTKAA